MSLSTNPPLSIVDLIDDCLFQIFPHLNLSDLLNIRLTCSRLNDAVCKYFPQITDLSFVYTEHGPEGIPSKNLIKDKEVRNAGDTYFESDWLDRNIADFNRKSTWRNNLIVIFGREKFRKFLQFINKHEIRNIKKLSIIVDPNPNKVVTLSQASKLFKLCPKVEKLFLERANRCLIPNSGYSEWTKNQSIFKVEDLGDLFDTITGLASLNELHFFTSHNYLSGIFLTPNDNREPSIIRNDQIKQLFGTFLLTMFRKLRIFGFNRFDQFETPFSQEHLAPLLGQNFENILELDIQDGDWRLVFNSGTKFPNLRSLTVFEGGICFENFNIGNSFQQLTTLRLGSSLCLNKSTMLKLDSFPSLEILSAHFLKVSNRDFVDGDFRRNQRIKHIEVGSVFWRRTDKDVPGHVRPLHPYTRFFQALETVTVLAPETGRVVYGRDTLKDLRMGSE